MKRSNIFLAVILCLLVLIVSGTSGCEKQTTIGAYIGGVKGLDIKFVTNEPPATVLDANSDQFFITVSLENKGETAIDSGDIKVTLDGVSKDEFQIKSLTMINTNPIEAAAKERQQAILGGKDEISYEAKYKSDLSSDFKATIGANVCYRYATEAISNLCLKKEVSARTRTEDACVTDETKKIENSGAPIQITGLSQRPAAQDKLKVVFDIENKGTGEVYSKSAFSTTCSGDETNKNKVYVEVKPIGTTGNKFQCAKLSNKDYGEVRLIDKKTTVTCELSTANMQETAFETPANIIVEYQYKERVTKSITVENAV